ncbi:hypothetical protein D3C72_1263710 [compost metagenome]
MGRTGSYGGPDRSADARCCRRVSGGAWRHRLLGHGHYPACAFGGHHPDDHQPAAVARPHRPAWRRALSGAGPQQCAGRPNHGHLGKAVCRSAEPAARCLWIRAAARAWRRCGGSHCPYARWQREGVFCAGRQLCGRDAGHGCHLAGTAALRPDGTCHHQTQPKPCGARARGADPAMPGAHRNRSAKRRGARRDGGGLDEHGAHLEGHQPASVRTPALRTCDHRPPGACDVGRTQPGGLAGAGARLLPDPRRDREGISGFCRLQPARGCAWRLSAAQYGQRAGMDHRHG